MEIDSSVSDSFSRAEVDLSVELAVERSILEGEGTFEQTRVEELSEASAALGGKIERIKEIF
jgi:hypothetical protein